MADQTAIEWADATFNPWVGCTKVSPGCDHCYAEAWAKRTGDPSLWNGHRRRTSDHNWRKPLKWNEAAARRGVRLRVFCASLADVFDNVVPRQWRADLFRTIARTPNLDWLLLTKRIGNAPRMLADVVDDVVGDYCGFIQLPLPNVWLGITVVNQEEADRDIPKLLAVPARVRFLSMEPLLSRVDLCRHFGMWWNQTMNCWESTGARMNSRGCDGRSGIDWVIVGGESGPGARGFDLAWARSIIEQCKAAGAACFIKQLGARPYATSATNEFVQRAGWPRDRKGGDILDFPPELRVRQFPTNLTEVL